MGIFIVWVVFITLKRKNKKKIESHKKVCENKDFCNVIIPFKDIKMLEICQYQKSDEASLLFM